MIKQDRAKENQPAIQRKSVKEESLHHSHIIRSLTDFCPLKPLEKTAAEKNQAHKHEDNDAQSIKSPNEKHAPAPQLTADDVRRILKRELRGISRNPDNARNCPKKGNERVFYIGVNAYPFVQKFKKSPNEEKNLAYYRILAAGLRYLEQGGNLDSLENLIKKLQNPNNDGGGS